MEPQPPVSNILVVDDITENIQVLGSILDKAGYAVSFATLGQEALDMVAEEAFDLILLDIMMPHMDGRQVCRAIREFSDVPIIILSALNDSETVASALDSGADDYLVKPVPSDVLAAHLKRIIKRTGKLSTSPERLVNSWIPETTAISTNPLKSA